MSLFIVRRFFFVFFVFSNFVCCQKLNEQYMVFPFFFIFSTVVLCIFFQFLFVFRLFLPMFFFFLFHHSQDYPKALGADAKVGFTTVNPWLCFSPCKNNIQDAAKAQVREILVKHQCVQCLSTVSTGVMVFVRT